MLEIPYLDEIVEEKTREKSRQYISAVLAARFGDVSQDVVEAIESVDDEKQLKDLVRLAAVCPDLAAVRHAITRR
jgi:hypothetical protein